jgi:hypothetical protein
LVLAKDEVLAPVASPGAILSVMSARSPVDKGDLLNDRSPAAEAT